MPRSGSSPAQRALWLVLVLVLLGVLGSACGGAPSTAPGKKDSASSERGAQASSTAHTADRQCRQRWRTLRDQVAPRAEEKFPSTLPDRWQSVVATLDYHVASATSADCGIQLRDQQQAIAQLTAFNDRLRVYDPEFQLERLRPQVSAYLRRSTTATAPVPKSRVRAALRDLSHDAPRAVHDMAAGWGELDT